NFKLKVLDAESLGLDTTTVFKTELEGYRQQLAQPYLTEKKVTETLVKQAYDRMQEEIRASHLLMNVKEDADPEDTLKAFQKITELRNKITSGESFESVAKANSQDPTVATNGGDLGYFTSLQMVYPFEEAAFKTAKGEVSQPIRTKFGYHLIKVNDRRPSQGKITVAHIMIRTNPDMPQDQATAAKQKIDEIYSRLQKGEDWKTLCQQFSQDTYTNQTGGELRPFGTSELGIPAFEETAFALKNVGEYTQPTQTLYGWHIIKLVQRQSIATFADLETILRQKVSKDSRSELNKTVLLERLKKENQFTENQANVILVVGKADTSLLKANWKYDVADKNLPKILFSLKNEPYSIKNFYDFVKMQTPRQDLKPITFMGNLYKEFVRKSVLAYEEKHLAEKYPDYKNLLQEYRDGILFFQRMQDMVWTKSLTDSVGAETFFKGNNAQYRLGKTAQIIVYDAANQDVINEVKQTLKRKKYPVASPASKTFYFLPNKETFKPEYEAEIAPIAEAMRRDTNLTIEIAVHADLRENEAIAAKRGNTISEMLKKNGVYAKQIVIKNFGKTKPVSRTDRAKNSRAEITYFSDSKTALEKFINKNDALRLQITEGTFEKGGDTFLDGISDWKAGTYNLQKNGRSIWLEILKVEEPRLKTFAEARGQVISDYQNELEKRWIISLKQKFPVMMNEAGVQQAISNLTK
ncbi:MAG: peptidylprolyl isomerase, partial [Verrucomicrobia bacterium]|nr:peptidylprolyl isomerase [Cytophagales bacterium]